MNNRYQIAVFGASDDLSTEYELTLAAHCGEQVAKLGLSLVTGGDDGVMGAAAKAAKYAGGKTVAVIPRHKTIQTPEIFDFIVDTGLNWIQFSDCIVRSCQGALIVGGGAGTLGELALLYLSDIPYAFLGTHTTISQRYGNQSLDTRNLFIAPVFESSLEALQFILKRTKGTEKEAAELADMAWNAHLECYPFGVSGEYLKSAELFKQAVMLHRVIGNHKAEAEAAAHMHDAYGDHFYYHEDDVFKALSQYVSALNIARQYNPDKREFIEYLSCLVLECVGTGLENIGELELAAEFFEKAANRYEEAMTQSEPESHIYLQHSSSVLRGDAQRLYAEKCLSRGLFLDAKNHLNVARNYYDKGLSLNPLWKNGFSDTYGRVIQIISQLEAKIASSLG